MKTRFLRDIEVSPIGMGCMGFSHGYGKVPEESYSIDAIRAAHDFGCTFFDTAEGYGREQFYPGHNEQLVGKAIKDFRKDIILATKLHVSPAELESGTTLYDAVKKHIQHSMENLQTDCIDLYYLHRVNENVPVEDVADAMGKLIKEGLIRGWGLSQVSKDTLDAANRVTPVASGFLSGKVTTETQFGEDDVRKWVPQLSKENITANQPILDILAKYAKEKNATNAQISLAWMLHKYPNVVPIPGSKNRERILENLGGWNVTLTDDEFTALEAALEACTVHGHRGTVEYEGKSFSRNWRK